MNLLCFKVFTTIVFGCFEMLPDSFCSNPCNKSEINWKNYMNECLIETKIFKKKKNEKYLQVDPNFVMNVRHRMVKQSKKIPMPQILIHAEALKLIRIENSQKLLRQKERKMVEKEIAKLKQMLENDRLSAKKKINEPMGRKLKSLLNMQKFPKHMVLCKRLECHNEIFNVPTWQHQFVQMEPKINKNAIPLDVDVLSNQEEYLYEFTEPILIQKGSIIENKNEFENKFWKIGEDKNEIIKKFFKEERVIIQQELLCDVKEPQKIMKNSGIENLINQKRMKNAWKTWKAFTEKLKSRKRARAMLKIKIETFLVNFRENEMREKKLKQLRNIIYLKQEIAASSTLKKKIIEKENQMNVEEKEEKLEKLMKEIKTSQVEARQKIKELRRRGLKNQEKFANMEFFKKMEERRAERLKRRKEIDEKKRKIEEKREKAQREREKEKMRQEEECKQKSLEEFKKKRRLEKERKERKKKEREKLRLHMRLADTYYEKYVLLNYGWRPWEALMKITVSQNHQAVMFFGNRLKQKILRKWTSNAGEQVALRVAQANAFYEKVLKKKSLLIWYSLYKEKMKQHQAAADWNDFKIIERTFKRWLNFVQVERIDYLNKKKTAELNYERKLKKKCITKLKSYPELKKLEQAKENRKKKWRQKVKEILPDYQPADFAENF